MSISDWVSDGGTSDLGAALWRRLKKQGFRGSLRVVTEWATRRRQSERIDAETLNRVPSARTIARLITTGRDTLSKAETVTVAAVATCVRKSGVEGTSVSVRVIPGRRLINTTTN